MTTIIHKIKKISGDGADSHPVRKAIGWQRQLRSNVWSPPTDMYETDESYIVRLEIAGMHEADFTVSVEGSFLVISGSRPDVTERRAYHQMEIRCGRFTSAIALPSSVNLEETSAKYEDGFFVAILPKI